MATLLDYLQWRGDLSFRQSAFNIVDSLILSRFSYLPFDSVFNADSASIFDLGTTFLKNNGKNHPDIVLPSDIDLLEIMIQSKRFKKIKVQHYQNIIDLKREQQFSAMTIQLDAHTTYIVFRGTDKTLVGWKEDFNMSFEKQIPAQLTAVTYLARVEPDCRSRVIIGGHSKGGNLAIYASIFAPHTLSQKIISIHNFDGPGLDESLLNTPEYHAKKHIMQTFIPETAIVGTIFNHDHDVTIVKSDATGLSQHDIFTWNVTPHTLVSTDHTDENSKKVQHSLNALLEHLTVEERHKIIDTIYHLFVDAGFTSLSDFQSIDLGRIKKIIQSMKNITKHERNLLQQAAILFIKHFKNK